ncbi:hypothetical protein PG993_005624 [Apiospora rasikravindrae]|uniref:F-box domain-containing protein n=1 Tax=Apiospora rasikravindrae TaxID=990691 RepID=A0ABR1TG39_9PEZI
MVNRLVTLPLELLHGVASLLLRPDQAALARTCKSLNVLLTPIVWGDVELHFRGTHEGVDLDAKLGNKDDDDDDEPSPEERAEYPFWDIVKEPPRRKYSQIEFDGTDQAGVDLHHHTHIDGRELETVGRASDMGNRRNLQFAKEEKFARVCFITPAPRWTELALHVQSLCMSIGIDDGVIKVLSGLCNLRSLELVGLPIPEAKPCPSTAPEMQMPALKNLKLRGFFPVAFLKAIFTNNAKTITHLNLGLLATKFDDENNSRGMLAGRSGASRDGGDDDKEEEDDDIYPWAFHSPLWLSDDLVRGFTSLTHLHLVKPFNGVNRLDSGGFDILPLEYEELVYGEWTRLLGATSESLKEVILEHRLFIDNSCVMDRSPGPEKKMSYKLSGDADLGDMLFGRTVLRHFLQQGGKRFGKLQHLALRGIRISRIYIGNYQDPSAIPGLGGRPDNDLLLRRAYPGCDIELVQNDVYGIYPYDGATYDGWDESRKEPRQDEGDGLLEDADYYREYLRRYGPQWRVSD